MLWLLEYGNVVWVFGLLALVGIGVFFEWWRPRTRNAARRAARSLGASHDLSSVNINAVVTLGGKLACMHPCERFEDGALVAATAAAVGAAKKDPPGLRPGTVFNRAQHLSLLHGNTQIDINGPIDLRAGSLEYHPGRKLSRLDQRIISRLATIAGDPLPFDLDRVCVFRSIRDGDRVLVRGCLERDSVAPEGSRYILAPISTGFGTSEVVEITYDGRSRLRWPEWTKVVRGVALGLLAFVLLFIGAGEAAYRLAKAGEVKAGGATAIRQAAYTLAAATPSRRSAALAGLHELLAADRDLDLQRLITLNRILRRCQDSFALLIAHQRYGEALEHRKRCKTPDRLAIALAYFRLGRFSEASDALAAHTPEEAPAHQWRLWAQIHLLADRFDRAASATRQLARHEASGEKNVVCLANALEAKKQDLERLSKQAAASSECSTILWDARQRLAQKSSAEVKPPSSNNRMLGRFLMLTAEAGLRVPPVHIPGSLSLTQAERVLIPGSLVDGVADLALRLAAQRRLMAIKSPDPHTRCLRATLAAGASSALLLLGRPSDARSLSRAMVEDFRQLRTEHRKRVRRVEQLLDSLQSRQLRLVFGDVGDAELAWLRRLDYRSKRVSEALARERRDRLPPNVREQFQRWLESLSPGQLRLLVEFVPNYRRKHRDAFREAEKSQRFTMFRSLLNRYQRKGFDLALSGKPKTRSLLSFMLKKDRKRLLASLLYEQRILLPSLRLEQYQQLLPSLSAARQRLLLSLLPDKRRRQLLSLLLEKSPKQLLETCFATDDLRTKLPAMLSTKHIKQLLIDPRDKKELLRLMASVDNDQQLLLLDSLRGGQYWLLRKELSDELQKQSRPQRRARQIERFGKLMATLKASQFNKLWGLVQDGDFNRLPRAVRKRLFETKSLSDEVSRTSFNNDQPLERYEQAVLFTAGLELRMRNTTGARKLAPAAGKRGALVVSLATSLQQNRRDQVIATLRGSSRLWNPDDAKAWQIVANGSVDDLATWLWRHRDDGARFLLLTAPDPKQDVEQLRLWLRGGDIATCDRCSLARVVGELSSRREATRILGDKEQNAQLAEVSERFAKALSNRKISVPLAVLEPPASKKRK